MKYVILFYYIFHLSFGFNVDTPHFNSPDPKPKVYYGIASYYADKFNGRPTANGEIYDHNKLTAACNILPLGTWIRVTNLKNNKSVIVKTNDRLHPRMKRIVDLSKSAAKLLAYTGRGLTQVKVEVLEKDPG
ncbi:MAG TPA: septal ring lytic transglycosylase RlpA family protein [Flavisolibacter sp.]|nr:septal ring lytic transglycosylase RlpA family protein [Flavisolibacter sp.]